MNRYVFFCAHSYAYPILRPLQDEIKRRGDEVRWFLEDTCPDLLEEGEQRLTAINDVIEYNPRAIFAPGDWVYDFLPGIKVRVCHGYPIYKRGGTTETHFRIRGWFDIYCSTGPTSTPIFKALEKQYGNFRVYETGWSKVDAIVAAREEAEALPQTERPKRIFVGSTFSKGISALHEFYPLISRLAEERDWEWYITRHPKLKDAQLDELYTQLAERNPRVKYYPVSPGPEVMASTDVMLCDASSIILEYMVLDKPVVTYRNTTAGPHLIDVTEIADVEQALLTAFTRPDALMREMRKYLAEHEAHTDGKNCSRILDAVDDFAANYAGKIGRRSPDLFRKLKLRWRLWRSAGTRSKI